MKMNFAVLCLALGLAPVTLAGAYAGEPAADTVILPKDEASLSRLNDAHLKVVRAAMRECNTTPRLTNETPGCIILSVERDVSQSGDPQLKAFNAKLPTGVRYDENRTINDINRVMQPSRQ
jgi:hypothetical protein